MIRLPAGPALAAACQSSGLTPDELASYNRDAQRPQLAQLERHAKRFRPDDAGAESIMAAGAHLEDEQRARLARTVAGAKLTRTEIEADRLVSYRRKRGRA